MLNVRARWWAVAAAGGLLAVMAGLMSRPLHEDSATEDEPLFLLSGYSYWLGYGYAMNPEQPALSQKIMALPLLAMDVTLTPPIKAGLDRQIGFETTRPWGPWAGSPQPIARLFPDGRRDWYFWPFKEGNSMGQLFLYGGDNDADRLLNACRWIQVGLTLLTGFVIFLWLRRLAGDWAGLMGLALWVFHPLALGYGPLLITDVGAALMAPLAVWACIEFVQRPTWRLAVGWGVATGLAVCMKFTAVLLGPIFVVLLVARWVTCSPPERRLGGCVRWLPLAFVVGLATVWCIYAPNWRPAPLLSPDRAALLGVPGWFQQLRPVLIPPDFFKGIALQAAHAKAGHVAYLSGEWKGSGWWYYFPLAILWKTPLPLLVLGAAALVAWLLNFRQTRFEIVAPLLAAFVYLGFAMSGRIDIGIRYLLPCAPLVTVGVCAIIAGQSRPWRLATVAMAAWLAIIAFVSRPYYLEYFNELAGGTRQGYRYLLDSNYDWGQDVKRLRDCLEQQHLEHVHLAYFGPRPALKYYRVPGEIIEPEDAQKLATGILVISAMRLMKPEWSWLRTGYVPTARVGCTLFVFDLGQHHQ